MNAPGVEQFGVEIGDEDAPASSVQALFIRNDATALGLPLEKASVGGGLYRGQTKGNQTTAEPLPSEPCGTINAVAFRRFEQFGQGRPVRGAKGDAGWQPADPESLAPANLAQRGDAKEAHVADQEIPFAAPVDTFEDEGLVSFTGGVELEIERLPIEQIDQQQALAASRCVAPVAIVGEVFGVALSHGNDNRILDKHPLKQAAAKVANDGWKPFCEHGVKDAQEECRGGWAEALVNGLAGHGGADERAEMHDEMVERGVALGDRLEEGEKEAGGGKLAGMALNQAGITGDEIEGIGRGQKMAYEHSQRAGRSQKSCLIRGLISLKKIENECATTLYSGK